MPEFRTAELTEELDRWKKLRLMSKRDVQRLLGKLSYVATCVPPGRPSLASLINAILAPNHVLLRWKFQVTLGMIYNGGGRLFLGKHNGISIFPGQSIIDSVELFSTDACRSGPWGGCGAILLDEFFHAEFSEFMAKLMLPIPQLELLTILVGIKLWKDTLHGHILTIYSDSDTAVQAIKNRLSKVDLCHGV